MKKILQALFLLAFLTVSVRSEDAPAIPVVTPQEAATQEGKQVKVKGVVDAQKTSAKGITYLNFGGRFPNHVFSCVLRTRDFPNGVPTYEGKEVEVTGMIKMYEGKPSMDIKSADQIRVLGAETAGSSPSAPSSPGGETEH